jgi:hypothetical protein
MCHSRAKIVLIGLFILGGSRAGAQTGAVSNPTNGRENIPYSKFGIGSLTDGNNAVLRGMGSISSAYTNPYQINTDNPASYADLQRTTFEVGGFGSSKTITGGGFTYATSTASLAYISVGVPIGKKAGLCFGFRPYSHSYYSLVDTALTSGNTSGRMEQSYNGEGGLNYGFIGAAAKHKGLSVGFNFGYLFGSFTQITAASPLDVTDVFTAVFANYKTLGGIYWKGGAAYEMKVDTFHTLRIGGTVSLNQNLTERVNAYNISTYNFGDTILNDTSGYAGERTGKLKMPLSYSVGALFSKNDKWSVGVDYAATQWSNFSSQPDSSMNVGVGDMSYKLSLGGELTPDITNIRNYFARVTYRMGVYYGSDYLRINNNTLPFYGITAGASLPFRKSLSRVHAAIDFGRLGTTANSMIQQNYVKFTVGISFNDKWFIPRKYE